MEMADAQKGHTETQDASKGLGLKVAKTIGSTHIPLTKASHRAKPRGRGNTPLLLQEQLQSHIQAEYGYQEGRRIEGNNSIAHSRVRERVLSSTQEEA